MVAASLPYVPLTDSQRAWQLACFASFLVIAIISIAYRRAQRRAKWAEVLHGAQGWAASVGGELKRVSEQPAVYGYKNSIVARRYRVTFVDSAGAQCIATLRWTAADDVWAMEKLVRDDPENSAGAQQLQPQPVDQIDLAAESFARRHRGRESDVPVIFAPPRKRRPPRRST